MTTLFSLVITALDASDGLGLLLSSLEAQTSYRCALEVVIVDDGASNAAAVIDGWKPDFPVHVIRHASPYGRAFSRNAGWQKAAGEIVVFLEPDAATLPGWLAAYEAAFARPDIDVVAGIRVAHRSRGRVPLNDQRSEDSSSAPAPHDLFAVLEREGENAAGDPHTFLGPLQLMTGNFAVRRDWLERADGFNPFLIRIECLELGLRLWEAGARFGSAPNAAVQSRSETPWLTGEEVNTLFVRHPFRQLLATALWGQARNLGSDDRGVASVLPFADWDLDHPLGEEFFRLYGIPLAVDCQQDFETTVTEYVKRDVRWVEGAAERLEEAVSRGLYRETRQGIPMFDVHRVATFITNCSPVFSLPGLTDALKRRRTPFQESLRPSDALTYHCRGIYEITIPTNLLQTYGGNARLNIAVPTEHTCQRKVVIQNAYPDNLMQFLDKRGEMILRYPVETTAGVPLTRIGYEFTCDILEFVPGRFDGEHGIDRDVLPEHLKPGIPPAYLQEAEAILMRIRADCNQSRHSRSRMSKSSGIGDRNSRRAVSETYALARQIFIWAWDTFEFQEVGGPFFLSFRTGYGACLQRMKVCQSLLRLAGIPAREVGGVHFFWGKHSDEPFEVVQAIPGPTPFMHTWIEFHTEEDGWTPYTEFCSSARYVSVAAASNETRNEVKALEQRCRDEFFGSLDPFRLYGSPKAGNLVTVPMVKISDGWDAPLDLAANTQHRVRCVLTKADVHSD